MLAGMLWNIRDSEPEAEEGNDETGEQSAKRKKMDTDDSHDSSTFVHRARARPESGLPKRFLDAVMLSEEEGSDSDVWVPRSQRAAQGKPILIPLPCTFPLKTSVAAFAKGAFDDIPLSDVKAAGISYEAPFWPSSSSCLPPCFLLLLSVVSTIPCCVSIIKSEILTRSGMRSLPMDCFEVKLREGL